MPLKAKKTATNLVKKGFDEDLTGDHARYVLSVDGQKTSIRTKISHGENELGEALINRMSKQLHLSKHDFVDLAECRLSGEAYLQKLREQGLL